MERARSGKARQLPRLLIATMAVGGVVAAGAGAFALAQGGPGSATPFAFETPGTTPTRAPAESPEVIELGPADASARLPIEQHGRHQHPVAAHDGQILVFSQRDVQPPAGSPVPQFPTQTDQQFLLWDPHTGDSRLLWSRTDGLHEMVISANAGWVLSVPYRGKLGDWQIVLRNLETGETRQLARHDARFAASKSSPSLIPYEAAHWGDLSFDALPVVDGQHVAWVQTIVASDGAVRQQVLLYDTDGNTTAPVFEVAEPRRLDDYGDWASGGHAWSAAVGGGTVAWVYQEAPTMPAALFVFDISTGETKPVDLPQEPAGVAVSGDGETLAVTVGGAVLLVDLASGEISRADGIPAIPAPHRLHFEGDYLWWGPPSPTPQLAGAMNIRDGQIWLTETPTHHALVTGDWFTWQERGRDDAPGVYHFVELPD